MTTNSDSDKCRNCPVRHKCTQSSNCTKVVTRYVWETSRERIDQHRLNRVGKRIYKRRKETVERSFADAKQLHGHRYARMRGLSKVQQECLLAATAQNIKKIAPMLSRTGPNTPVPPSWRFYKPIQPSSSHTWTSAKPPQSLAEIQNTRNKPHQNDGVRQQFEGWQGASPSTGFRNGDSLLFWDVLNVRHCVACSTRSI
jgi:hypothetical protein